MKSSYIYSIINNSFPHHIGEKS